MWEPGGAIPPATRFGGVVCVISMLRRINRLVTKHSDVGNSGKKIAMHWTDGPSSGHKCDAVLRSRWAAWDHSTSQILRQV